MKVNVIVTGERVKTTGHYISRTTEPYTVAELDIEGLPGLIADSLRALADSIQPKDIR